MTFFEGRGLPSVAVISNVFQEPAKKQEVALGAQDVKKVWVQHPIQDRTDAEMHGKADLIFDQIVAGLIHSSNVPALQALPASSSRL
jgi:hypothetical protein